MTTNQPTEREVRDLLAGTLAAEAFDQKYGAGAANKVIELNNNPIGDFLSRPCPFDGHEKCDTKDY